MKHFFKLVFAVVVGLGISALLFVILLAAVVRVSSGAITPIVDNTVLKLNFNYEVSDRTKMEEIDLLSGSFSMGELLGLEEVLKAIENAKTDKKIKGIYIEMAMMPNGFATLDALRRALIDFKTSDKFVIAYGEYVSQKAYYLASVADNIYINPEGLVEMRGIGTQLTFFKKFLDNIDASVEVFKVGTFKSAIEPFIREDASEANRQQLEFLLGGVKEDFINNISRDRKIDKLNLEKYINELAFSSADTCVELGLIDAVKYYDEVLSEMASKMGLAKVEDIKFVSLSKYHSTILPNLKKSDQKIAVVYAEGDIVSAKTKNSLSSEEYAQIISKLRQDDKIKAIVLRINSPGGSALASEVIWREIEKAKETKKVVVSMGSVAASGGYYIACNADRIFAEENTITGSIGVFGLVPNIEKFLENKIGVTFDEINLNDHASMNGVTNTLDDYEKSIIQKGVDKVYDTFTKRVAVGRGMHQDSVKVYAEGRVWTGEQAKKIGLVDEIGDLRDAIKYAAKLIQAEDYEIQTFPKKKEAIEEVMEQFGMEKVKENMLKKELGMMYPYYKETKKLEAGFNIIQAKMPFALEIK